MAPDSTPSTTVLLTLSLHPYQRIEQSSPFWANFLLITGSICTTFLLQEEHDPAFAGHHTQVINCVALVLRRRVPIATHSNTHWYSLCTHRLHPHSAGINQNQLKGAFSQFTSPGSFCVHWAHTKTRYAPAVHKDTYIFADVQHSVSAIERCTKNRLLF